DVDVHRRRRRVSAHDGTRRRALASFARARSQRFSRPIGSARAPGLVLHASGRSKREASMNAISVGSAGAGLLAIALAGPAAAQDRLFTVKELVGLCKSGEAQRQSACNGFITGVRHTLDVFKNSLKDRVAYCIPRTINNRDFRDGFLAWAERNPNEF